MSELIRHKIQDSLYKGFIDRNRSILGHYNPKVLTNKDNNNVLRTLLHELNSCNTFFFSVAFITKGGLATLKTVLQELHKRGISGKILTSTFLYFNKPKTFKELLKIPNIEVKLSSEKGFHSKGYIFEKNDYYSLIVGSSNLTDHALKSNYEWNIYLTSLENGDIIQHFKKQFEQAWDNAIPLTEEWIITYRELYEKQADKHSKMVHLDPKETYASNKLREALEIKPNKMQEQALAQLKQLRNTGAKKGLIISATGTGKTYLSAFDIRNANPERVLFIVHREQILKKAKQEFQKILGGDEDDFGILSGNSKDTNAKYLFATVQTMSRDPYLQSFTNDHFDYVLIDEVHRAGAESYLKIINYFEPKFMLGMTATPERTDNFNIYELFDYNIAYEIRLQAALEEDMLCPFHYFGVVDYEINGVTIDDTTPLKFLVSDERINHMIEKVQYYGYSGEKLRGLIFCSRKEEAKELSEKLNARGIRTACLTGDHSQDEREKTIKDLEDGIIQYIITVDIFNEGIDIPFVNQIVMLRQTQSSIIFTQQLGRGLRKHGEKDYVTIIDFIGNYKNNYLIPIALSGDKSLNKDNVRRKTVNTDYLKGVSTINFEEIAKKRIFEAINQSNLSTLKNLKEAYTEIKNRTNKIPALYDFIKHDTLDPEVIIDYADTYYNFLLKVKEEIPALTPHEVQVLSMISNEFINGKRIHEVVLLEQLLKNQKITNDQFIEALYTENTYVNDETIRSVQLIFSLDFHTANDQKKYGHTPIIEFNNNKYHFHEKVAASLKNDYFKQYIEDVLKCARHKSKQYDLSKPLTINQKYSRRDVCRLLNWESDSSSTIYGYRTKFGSTPTFVTYHKHEEVEASIAYSEEFLSPEIFKWSTRSRMTTESKEVQEILNHRENGNQLYLFVKKEDGEGTDFYYLGQTEVDLSNVVNTTMSDKHGNPLPVVNMNLILKNPVDQNIFNYIVEQ